ncbi:uncharacterized protein LOC128155001 [Harpia harpyja]|uniref:uncharacterized protein LOC128155001 n=1 Tax=Harpia harpyja TaxID=202280 RepID=UPI0022B1CA76|nr:uncharacterized protein LOC128155001 [Harpia harpyja]
MPRDTSARKPRAGRLHLPASRGPQPSLSINPMRTPSSPRAQTRPGSLRRAQTSAPGTPTLAQGSTAIGPRPAPTLPQPADTLTRYASGTAPRSGTVPAQGSPHRTRSGNCLGLPFPRDPPSPRQSLNPGQRCSEEEEEAAPLSQTSCSTGPANSPSVSSVAFQPQPQPLPPAPTPTAVAHGDYRVSWFQLV